MIVDACRSRKTALRKSERDIGLDAPSADQSSEMKGIPSFETPKELAGYQVEKPNPPEAIQVNPKDYQESE